jgi:hypothetical protein
MQGYAQTTIQGQCMTKDGRTSALLKNKAANFKLGYGQQGNDQYSLKNSLEGGSTSIEQKWKVEMPGSKKITKLGQVNW